MGHVPGESYGIADVEGDRLVRDADCDCAFLNLQELLRAGRVGLAGVLVARSQNPVPQFNNFGRFCPGHELAAATGFAAPEDRTLTLTDHLDGLGFGGLDQVREAHPQGIADPQQRAHAGVHGGLFHIDNHATADACRFGQLVQCPAAGLPLLLDTGAD